MRVIVLGASNEISPLGWTKSLTETCDLIKGSIGASSSSAGIWSLLKMGDIRADFAVLSYELNEDEIFSKGLISELRIRENWRWLFLKCRSMGIEPVLLILPKLKGGIFCEGKVKLIQREVAKEFGVGIIDLHNIFIELGSSKPQKLMLDNVHIKQAQAQAVGKYIRECLIYISRLTDTSIKCGISPNYFIEQFSGKSDLFKTVIRKTSVVSANLITINEGDLFQLKCDEPGELLAIVGNRLSLGGVLSISNHNKAYSFCDSIDDLGRFMSIAVDVKPGFFIDRGIVDITIKSPPLPEIEPSHMQRDYLPSIRRTVELEGLIMVSRENLVTFEGKSKNIPILDITDTVNMNNLRLELNTITA